MRWISRARGRLALVSLALLCVAGPAFAVGQLCGSIHDAATASPVAGAGVFAYTTAGSYTGYNATSDATGAFCINGIPPGTYDLQVLRDHYLPQIVRGVNAQDVTGVDIGLRPLAGALLPPVPNPARDRVQLRFRLGDAAPARLDVLDPQGRRLKGWIDRSAAAGSHTVTWDFHDALGHELPAGCYFVRLTVNGATTTRAFARVR